MTAPHITGALFASTCIAAFAFTASAQTASKVEAAAEISAAAVQASDDYRLVILHSNDFHSRFEPVSKYDSTCSAGDDAEGKCFGGAARMKTFLDQEREKLKGQNVLNLSAGDLFQGSLFYTTYKGAATAEIMNTFGYDAMAVGNHEFDDGPEVLSNFIDKAQFPIISGNTDVSAESVLAGRVPGYIVKEVGGEKIAIVSVLATDTDETSAPGPNVKFANEEDYLGKVIPEIEAEGVNKIIVLSHVGYIRDQEIAAAVPGIDVIVGGHSHTFLSASDPKREGQYPTWVTGPDGTLVPIVQAYAYSRYIGELTVDFDGKGVVQFAEGDAYALDSSVKPDPTIAARIAELGAPLEEVKKKVVGESTGPIDGDRTSCRARECEMGVLIADAMLDATKDKGISIAIANGGGMRASVDAGPITMGEVLTVLPFQNTIATMKLSGANIVAALEGGVAGIEEGAGRFPQVAGLRYAFDAGAPVGSRIKRVEVADGDGWKEIDGEAIYGVVTNNYMRGGGDGYDTFRDHAIDPYDFGPNLEETVASYLTAHAPYTPVLKNRIVAGKGFAVAEPAVIAPKEEAPAEEAKEVTPVEKPAKKAPAPEAVYVVKAGDNLWDIAKSQLGDATLHTAISEANGLPEGATLSIGQDLKLPN